MIRIKTIFKASPPVANLPLTAWFVVKDFQTACKKEIFALRLERGIVGSSLVSELRVNAAASRPPATEMIMVMHGLDVELDMENEFYAVNGVANYYAEHPIGLKVGEKVRVYLSNMTEFDLVNNSKPTHNT